MLEIHPRARDAINEHADTLLVRLRVWVPQDRAAEVVAFADHLRRGEGIVEPSTPKQRYEVRRAAKRRGIPEPPPDVLGDRYRLEVWLLWSAWT